MVELDPQQLHPNVAGCGQQRESGALSAGGALVWLCNEAWPAVTFAEWLPSVVRPSAQRTVCLTVNLNGLGLALGRKAGARLSKRLGMAASPSTVLRLVRQTALPSFPNPRVLGVDDFAVRKGRVYGSLLVDDETHRPVPVDVIRERTAEALSA